MQSLDGDFALQNLPFPFTAFAWTDWLTSWCSHHSLTWPGRASHLLVLSLGISLFRLSCCGGVKCISGLDPWCSQNHARKHVLSSFCFALLLLTLSQVIRNSVTYTEHAVTTLDVVCVLKRFSCTLYGFGALVCCTLASSYFYLSLYNCNLISLPALLYTGRNVVWLVVGLRLGHGCVGTRDQVRKGVKGVAQGQSVVLSFSQYF
jgi:hypothetical protein